ncbi:hypothetical protein [Mongoliitalea daihaiensis]|uniref:hypothetical protein n=1 Tax=Mongoliitalea daihaiensis TaxID=2782006 RepID=UPI001F332B51|nr:hypothetical protein [Mongoliitalea daihaiensis]UJP65533.1 hypothetical protein IPZ59_02580 [Mongoliitalea daihaiensis]
MKKIMPISTTRCQGFNLIPLGVPIFGQSLGCQDVGDFDFASDAPFIIIYKVKASTLGIKNGLF